MRGIYDIKDELVGIQLQITTVSQQPKEISQEEHLSGLRKRRDDLRLELQQARRKALNKSS